MGREPQQIHKLISGTYHMNLTLSFANLMCFYSFPFILSLIES
jgi:hypothetical protein